MKDEMKQNTKYKGIQKFCNIYHVYHMIEAVQTVEDTFSVW